MPNIRKSAYRNATTCRKVLVFAGIYVDHTNPSEKKAKEAKGHLYDFEAATMRRLPLLGRALAHIKCVLVRWSMIKPRNQLV